MYLLGEMEAAFQKPIYFVLGNHDFYGTNCPDADRVALPGSPITSPTCPRKVVQPTPDGDGRHTMGRCPLGRYWPLGRSPE